MSERIYGRHPVMEAIETGANLEKIYLKVGTKGDHLSLAARKAGVPVSYVPQEKLDRLSKGANHQGVVAQIAMVGYQDLDTVIEAVLEKKEVPLFIMLDGVTDVRNMGAIARTAECLGAHALIVPASGSAPLSADAVKTSAGALMHLPVCRVGHLVDAMLLLQSHDIAIISATEKAKESIYHMNMTGPLCIVMGNEERGVSSSIIKRSDELANIPMRGNINSLNVSVASALVIGEVARQRWGL
ncbi:MAG: 23S rRNA (guanosine(2251)-2'-O)-methyltransferase RlmB [Bacteroidia bacterium]